MYSTDIIKLAIHLYKKYKTFRLVESIIEVSKSTIHRWVMNPLKYLQKGTKNKQVRTRKISIIIKNFIKELVEDDPFIRLKNISDKIIKQFGISISLTYISRIIKQLGYTSKKITKRNYNTKISTEETIIKKNDFIKNIQKTNINKIISIDESYFYLYNYPNKGKSLKGTKCIIQEPIGRHKQSLLLAITNKKILKYFITSKNINQYLYLNFIKQLPKNNNTIICDNVSFHKTKNVIKEINKSNKVIFIPPYSPEFNPIEFVFSEIKRKLRYKTFMNIIELNKYIIKKLKNIQKSNLNSYFVHSLKNQYKEYINKKY